MPRNQTKLAALLLAAGLAAATPAPAQNPTAPTIATNVPAPDVSARMWAATARYVYADDPALQPLLPQLLPTVDSTSLLAFGRGLEKAVALEKGAAPGQGHVLTFQSKYKTLADDASNADPAALAASIEQELSKNPKRMPGGRPAPAFAALLARLHALAEPAVPTSPATAAPAETPAPPATITATAAPAATGGGPAWLPLALSALSLVLAGLALARSGQRSSRHHRHHSSAPAGPSESDIRHMVRREVEKALASQPAPPPPAAPAPPAPEPVATAEVAPVAAMPAPAPAAAAPKLYANQQPIDGVFQRNSLAGAPAAYTMYELLPDEGSPDVARFAVTGNPAGHAGFIGSHQSILGGACEYAYPQGGAARIVTDVPGTAQRTPAGDWQITRKAQIHFEGA